MMMMVIGALILLALLGIGEGSATPRCVRRPNLHFPEPHNVFDYRAGYTSPTNAEVCLTCCDQNPSRWDEKWTVQHTYTKRIFYCQCDELDKKSLSECRKPNGDDCHWYFTCLNRYSTNPASFNTVGNYALGYGYKYCQRYGENLNKFTTEGQAWISTTRKCLQEALAAYVGTDKTNDEIKKIAFESHTRCYVENGLCQLPPLDWGVMVNTVGDALLSEFLKTGGNVITSSAQCAPRVAARIGRWTWGKANAAVDSVEKVVDVAKSVKDAVSDGIDAISKTVQKIDNLKKAFLGDMLPKLG